MKWLDILLLSLWKGFHQILLSHNPKGSFSETILAMTWRLHILTGCGLDLVWTVVIRFYYPAFKSDRLLSRAFGCGWFLWQIVIISSQICLGLLERTTNFTFLAQRHLILSLPLFIYRRLSQKCLWKQFHFTSFGCEFWIVTPYYTIF